MNLDSEEFATRHSQKFNVQFMNRQSTPTDVNKSNNNNNKKNVSFESGEEDLKNKSILKTSSEEPSSLSPKSTDSSQVNPNEKSDASILVSANSAKNKKTEGYEILVSDHFYMTNFDYFIGYIKFLITLTKNIIINRFIRFFCTICMSFNLTFILFYTFKKSVLS